MNPRTTQNPLPPSPLPPAAYEELLNYLHESRSPLSPAEALSHAVKLWISQDRADAIPTRGYQWKQLFLPEGTFVRLRVEDEWYIAKVKGDDLLYRGNAVSPHQMAQQAAGAGRNAWREMWIRFPGEKNWKNAAQLRAMMVSQSNRLPLSPADAMASAAKSMSPLSAPHSSSLNTPTINHKIPWNAVCRDIAGSLI
jgi:hypothetical protein